MSVILDTTVLIDPITLDDDEDYAISVVTIAELQFGVLRSAGSSSQAGRLQRPWQPSRQRRRRARIADFTAAALRHPHLVAL